MGHSNGGQESGSKPPRTYDENIATARRANNYISRRWLGPRGEPADQEAGMHDEVHGDRRATRLQEMHRRILKDAPDRPSNHGPRPDTLENAQSAPSM